MVPPSEGGQVIMSHWVWLERVRVRGQVSLGQRQANLPSRYSYYFSLVVKKVIPLLLSISYLISDSDPSLPVPYTSLFHNFVLRIHSQIHQIPKNIRFFFTWAQAKPVLTLSGPFLWMNGGIIRECSWVLCCVWICKERPFQGKVTVSGRWAWEGYQNWSGGSDSDGLKKKCLWWIKRSIVVLRADRSQRAELAGVRPFSRSR
jgi:hypothetical protein